MTSDRRLAKLTARNIGIHVGDGQGTYLGTITAGDITTGRWTVTAPDNTEHEYYGHQLYERDKPNG
jgi:hypothetical protein